MHCLALGRLCQGSEGLDRITRFRAHGIIGADICGTNYPRPGDYEAGRHRQCPCLISVELRKINAEAQVDLTQVLRELKDQVELRCHAIAWVAQ